LGGGRQNGRKKNIALGKMAWYHPQISGIIRNEGGTKTRLETKGPKAAGGALSLEGKGRKKTEKGKKGRLGPRTVRHDNGARSGTSPTQQAL